MACSVYPVDLLAVSADYLGLIDYPTVIRQVDPADQFLDYFDQADLIGPFDRADSVVPADRAGSVARVVPFDLAGLGDY